MKKLFYFAAAAVALAACAKNEVIPVNSGENQEITFNVAPKTKGTVPSTDPSYTVPPTDPRYFNTDNHFVSYAYFRGEENKWPDTDGKIYINAAEISFNKVERKWKAASTYYWPKSDKSSLTFFAWSTNSASTTLAGLAGGAKVSCDSKSGISVSGYDVTKNNKVDLLVADVAANKNANENIYSHNGVPTLFRHKLSYLIFKVKTATNYASAGKEFALKSIKILGVNSRGTYSQNATTTNSDGSYNTVGSWEVTDSKTAQTYFDVTDPVVFGDEDIILESDNNFKGSVVQKYYLPQTITAIDGDPSSTTNYTIEVVYTIKTTETNPATSTSTVTTETVTKYIKASEIYGEKWEINKKYTCTLTFSLNEILWDPAVENWDEVDIPTSGLTTI